MHNSEPLKTDSQGKSAQSVHERGRGGGVECKDVSLKVKMPVSMYRSIIWNFLNAMIHTIKPCSLAHLRDTSCVYRGADKSLGRPDRKKQLKVRHFSSDAEVIAAAETCLDGQPSEFVVSGLQKFEFGRCSLFLSWSG